MQADIKIRRLNKNSRVTPMTLALFEDSGWFKADYTQLSFNPGREWGHLAGCDLFTKRGVYPADPSDPMANLQVVRTAAPLRNQDPFFCLAGGRGRTCTMDLRAAGQCQVNEFNLRDIEAPYRYFTSAKKSGTFPENDQLPHVGPNFQCNFESSRTSQEEMWTAIGSYFGQEHSSAGFSTSLQHSGEGRRSSTGCCRFECDMSTPASPVLTIQPLTMGKDGVQGEAVCRKGDGGEAKSITGMTGTVTCVEPEVLCGSNAEPSPIPSASPSPAGSPEGGGGGGGGDVNPSTIPATGSPSPAVASPFPRCQPRRESFFPAYRNPGHGARGGFLPWHHRGTHERRLPLCGRCSSFIGWHHRRSTDVRSCPGPTGSKCPRARCRYISCGHQGAGIRVWVWVWRRYPTRAPSAGERQ